MPFIPNDFILLTYCFIIICTELVFAYPLFPDCLSKAPWLLTQSSLSGWNLCRHLTFRCWTARSRCCVRTSSPAAILSHSAPARYDDRHSNNQHCDDREGHAHTDDDAHPSGPSLSTVLQWTETEKVTGLGHQVHRCQVVWLVRDFVWLMTYGSLSNAWWRFYDVDWTRNASRFSVCMRRFEISNHSH